MLKIVNEELFAFNPVTITENGKEYAKLSIANTNKIVAYVTPKENKKPAASKGSVKVIKSSEDPKGDIQTVKKEICRVSAPAEMIGDFTAQSIHTSSVDFYGAMSSYIDYTNKYQPSVEVRCHEKGDDRANIYVIAFPFNGKIQPLKEDPRYRIYKGVLVTSSARPFYFNSRKYRKVLYLVVEINKNLFDPSHKYHTDNIDIILNSSVLHTDRETGEVSTVKEEFILNITSTEGEYTTSWNYVETPGEEHFEEEGPLWVTYKRPIPPKYFKDDEREDHSSYERNDYRPNKPKYKSEKPSHIEGDMVVTINRHGIRKEIPMANKSYKKNYEDREFKYTKNHSIDDSNNFERMLRNSGIYDEDEERYPRKKGNKKSGNSKKRKSY